MLYVHLITLPDGTHGLFPPIVIQGKEVFTEASGFDPCKVLTSTVVPLQAVRSY